MQEKGSNAGNGNKLARTMIPSISRRPFLSHPVCFMCTMVFYARFYQTWIWTQILRYVVLALATRNIISYRSAQIHSPHSPLCDVLPPRRETWCNGQQWLPGILSYPFKYVQWFLMLDLVLNTDFEMCCTGTCYKEYCFMLVRPNLASIAFRAHCVQFVSRGHAIFQQKPSVPPCIVELCCWVHFGSKLVHEISSRPYPPGKRPDFRAKVATIPAIERALLPTDPNSVSKDASGGQRRGRGPRGLKGFRWAQEVAVCRLL